jgi:hypothetical protein
VGGVGRAAPDPPGPHAVDLKSGHTSGKSVGSCIAEEMDRFAALEELAGERLGREKVPAGAAGGEHEGAIHNGLPPSRRLVSASIIPIPSPRASIEDPP